MALLLYVRSNFDIRAGIISGHIEQPRQTPFYGHI